MEGAVRKKLRTEGEKETLKRELQGSHDEEAALRMKKPRRTNYMTQNQRKKNTEDS